MTLVVARINGPQIAIASDTLVTKNGLRLPIREGVIKSCLLPGGICASFANSPDLGLRDCWTFYKTHPQGADFSDAVEFFEASSRKTNNDYILAFAQNPKIIKIADGRRQASVSKTIWIGDKAAYEAFREVESDNKRRYEKGRAITAALFADEMANSPASDIFSIVRQVTLSPKIESVGGFVCVISNREKSFRQSVYSDLLYNWPLGEGDDYIYDHNAKYHFGASGENEAYSISQFSTAYGNFNLVGYYLLKARMAYLFHPTSTLLADRCTVLENVTPDELESRLRETIKLDLNWLLYVAGPAPGSTVLRSPSPTDKGGVSFSLKMHVNTFPGSGQHRAVPPLYAHLAEISNEDQPAPGAEEGPSRRD